MPRWRRAHRFLRVCPGTSPWPSGYRGDGGEPTRQDPPSPRQGRRRRRWSRSQGGAVRSRHHDREDHPRPRGDGPHVQASQGICDHITHPAINRPKAVPASAHPHVAGCVARAEHSHTHCPPRRTRSFPAAPRSMPTRRSIFCRPRLTRFAYPPAASASRLSRSTISTNRVGIVLEAHVPELLRRPGAGPDTAAALIITTGDNPDRAHSEASFAALCGASPIEASPGKVHRRRTQPQRRPPSQRRPLSHRPVTPALSRPPCHARPVTPALGTRTQGDLARRPNQGKTRREAIRCLKRSIAHEIYSLISSPSNTPTAPPHAARHP
ncbi:transposase [Kibdelosporangium phytohabitans]|uniref:transposase n=1 Tax=Kibdelosporangium phytohabitans TaxID=860235 RepID=UPI0009FAF8A6